jgi:hypothetical protein
MKLTPWYLVALAPIAAAGCSGALFGQCAVLLVTLCIFVGTLTLGQHQGQHQGTGARQGGGGQARATERPRGASNASPGGAMAPASADGVSSGTAPAGAPSSSDTKGSSGSV